MQKFSRVFFVALAFAAAFSFTSCEKDDPYKKEVIDFQDVTLSSDGYWNGSDGSGPKVIGMSSFNNVYTVFDSGYEAWSGFAFSNTTDIKDVSYNNEFSAYVSSGGDAKNIYAVSYASDDAASISFLSEVNILKADFTNTTIAYFSMLNGDGFAKKFEKDDWFKLTVIGFDAAGTKKAEVEYLLADYTNGKSFIASNWTEVDLTDLKGVAKLVFNLESTDNGDWGMNTPAYFCMDNLKFEYLK